MESNSEGGMRRGVTRSSSRVSRKSDASSSMYKDLGMEIKPEKEPLYIDEDNIIPEMMPAMRPLLDLANQKLWHWKTFPIILPLPITDSHSASSVGRKKTLNIRDLFVEPDFQELEAVATDSQGEHKKLNQAQLQSVRNTGEFQVDSVQFSGQKHTWRLSWLLMKGSDRSTETMFTELSYALGLLVVTARDCLVGPKFSLLNSVNGWSEGLMNLVDMLVGLSDLETDNLELRLHEERAKNLVAELTSEDNKIVDLVRTMRDKEVEIQSETLTYVFRTAREKEIDLRLCSKEIMSRTKSVLINILEKESQGWFTEFKETILSQLGSSLMSSKELEQEANRQVTMEYVRRVTEAVLANDKISDIGPGIGRLLVNQLRAGIVFQQALQTSEQRLDEVLQLEKRRLRDQFPVRFKIHSWLSGQLADIKKDHLLTNHWAAHSQALVGCKEANLLQHAYFLSRDLSFLRDREHVLQSELSNSFLKIPSHTFEFRCNIWDPANWVVTKECGDTKEVITTVVNTQSVPCKSVGDKPLYRLQKNIVYHNTSRQIFWRWTNFCLRTWTWTWNFLYIFSVYLPWCSIFSLRSLLYSEPFYPDYEISQDDGSLHRISDSITQTLSSRLGSLWRHISKSRTEFEARPDRGLLGKSVMQHFNRINNYLLKGLLGTLVLVLLFPLMCVLVSTLSLGLALLGPILVPTISLMLHLSTSLIYDIETGTWTVSLVPSLVWNILVIGILQPIGAIFISLVLCPIGALLITFWAVTRKIIRHGWDSVMFYLVVSKKARVPAGDSFIVKRIGGPGMASNFFYQIKTEQALVALEARIEIDELEAYKDQISILISSPLEVYHNFVSGMLRPLSLAVSKTGQGPYQQLDKEVTDLLTRLQEKVTLRMGQLRLLLPETMKKRIKLSERELKLSLSRGAVMVQSFYPTHVINRLEETQKFWDKRGLSPHDWIGLTSQLYCQIFTNDFLTPMQEADTTFHLKTDHWNLTRYLNMVLESDWNDDLDVARAVQTPRPINLQIQSPYLDLSLFNPLATTGTHLATLPNRSGKLRWNVLPVQHNNLLPRLCVPLPVPHPAEVCLVIYNRDREIQISGEEYRAIVRELLELPDQTKLIEPRERQIQRERSSSCDQLERVRVISRTQSVLEGAIAKPLVAQYWVKSETSVARLKESIQGELRGRIYSTDV